MKVSRSPSFCVMSSAKAFSRRAQFYSSRHNKLATHAIPMPTTTRTDTGKGKEGRDTSFVSMWRAISITTFCTTRKFFTPSESTAAASRSTTPASNRYLQRRRRRRAKKLESCDTRANRHRYRDRLGRLLFEQTGVLRLPLALLQVQISSTVCGEW